MSYLQDVEYSEMQKIYEGDVENKLFPKWNLNNLSDNHFLYDLCEDAVSYH